MLEALLKRIVFGWAKLMYASGSDTDRAKEVEVTEQIAVFLQENAVCRSCKIVRLFASSN